MNNFPKLTEVVEKNLVIELDKAPIELVKEIQTKLKLKGLYNYTVDGIVGRLTRGAFAEFKQSIWLNKPTLIGSSVAASLLEIGRHRVSEQLAFCERKEQQLTQTINFNIIEIDKTGSSMRLPNGDIVYENQAIIQGIPLTWGEVTKGCKRVPESNQIVTNIIRTARGFGEIRDKWGNPIIITSGYRPPAVNRAVGGASHSQHIRGLALDCRPLQGDINKFFEVCRASDCTGLGRGMPRFVHLDWREGSRVIFDY